MFRFFILTLTFNVRECDEKNADPKSKEYLNCSEYYTLFTFAKEKKPCC